MYTVYHTVSAAEKSASLDLAEVLTAGLKVGLLLLLLPALVNSGELLLLEAADGRLRPFFC
jgi:hypothetical protein